MELLDDSKCPLPALTLQGFANFVTNTVNILWMSAEITDGLCERVRGRIQLIRC